MLAKDCSRIRPNVSFLWAMILGGGLLLVLAGSAAPNAAIASSGSAPTGSNDVGVLPGCVPPNANYVIKETTGTLVPGTEDIGLHCSERSEEHTSEL